MWSEWLAATIAFLKRREKPAQSAGSINCVVFMAYMMQIASSDVPEYTRMLLSAADDLDNPLDVRVDEEDGSRILYVGLRRWSQAVVAEVEQAAARSAEAIELEQTQAMLYELRFQHGELQRNMQSLQRERDDAIAAADHAREETRLARREAQDSAEEAKVWEELAEGKPRRAPADIERIQTLEAANTTLTESVKRQRQEIADATKRHAELKKRFDEARAREQTHVCSVPGLRLLWTAPDGSRLIADHRDSDGTLDLLWDVVVDRVTVTFKPEVVKQQGAPGAEYVPSGRTFKGKLTTESRHTVLAVPRSKRSR